MLGSLEKVSKTQKVFKASAREIEDKHAAFLFFCLFFFFQCSSFFFLFITLFTLLPAPLDCLAVCQSVRPPDGLIQTARGAHGSGGVAVASVSLDTLALGV